MANRSPASNLKKALLSSAFFIACMAGGFGAASCNGDHPDPAPNKNDLVEDSACAVEPAQLANLESGAVKQVIDGDTLHLLDGRKIRLLGIDAPEINHQSPQRSEAYAQEARHWLQQQVPPGTTVWLQGDKQKKDKYRRQLRYVYGAQGKNLNAQLVVAGLATLFLLPPNELHWQCLRQAERRARNAGEGLWQLPEWAVKSVAKARLTKGLWLLEGPVTGLREYPQRLRIEVAGRVYLSVAREEMRYMHGKAFIVGEKLRFRSYLRKCGSKWCGRLRHRVDVLDSAPTN